MDDKVVNWVVINREDIQKMVFEEYFLDDLTIGVLGSHSALDICKGAKDEGFKTLVVCKKGREKPYTIYFKTRQRGDEVIGCIDLPLVLNEWSEMVDEGNLKILQSQNTVVIPHRSLEVYLKFYSIENLLKVPIFGNRTLLRAEERTKPDMIEKNQDYLVRIADIPTPKRFDSPYKIDRPVIVKATKAIGERAFEREFPIVNSSEQYDEICVKLVKRGKNEEEKRSIEKNFRSAPIEEYIEGEKVNLNFFYSIIYEELELLGTDTRLQFPNGEELAHLPLSLRESLLKKAYDMGEKFVKACKKEYPPGIIGPFALQCIGDEREDLKVYDISLRIPGSPDTKITPYTGYLFGSGVSFGRRIAREIKDAIRFDRLNEIVT